MNGKSEIETKAKFEDNGLGVTLQAMFDGLEGVLKSKTIVGDAIDVGDIKLIPLIEISAGMAGGSFAEAAKAKGAAGMTAKMSPVAMLMIQGERVRLINVKNQDMTTKLIDLIPDAVEKITGKIINPADIKKAEEIAGNYKTKVTKE